MVPMTSVHHHTKLPQLSCSHTPILNNSHTFNKMTKLKESKR